MATSPAPLGAYSVDSGRVSVAGQRLAAGTYLDRDFRDHVLRDIYCARGRRVAPSHGFDLIPVIRHAWHAWWLEAGQHVLLLTVLGCWFAVRPLDTVMAFDLLVIWELLPRWLNWVLEDLSYGSRSALARDRPEQAPEGNLSFRGRPLTRPIAGALAALIALLLISAGSRRPWTSMASWAAPTMFTVAGIVLTLIAVLAVTAAIRAWHVARLRSVAPRRPARLGRRLRAIEQQQRHPFTVHSGFRPFLGSGTRIRGWSFAQRLVRANLGGTGPGAEFERPPFTALRLVGRLSETIAALQYDDNPETSLPGLSVADYVFVEGTRTAGISAALAAEQESEEVKRAIADVITRSSGVARHYLCAQVVSWGGEVVTSVFVHVSLQGRTLYLEFATCALYPVQPEYGSDWVGGTHAREITQAIGAAIAGLPGHMLEIRRLARVPATLLPALRATGARTPVAATYRDIGAESSIRETAMIERPSESRDESESGYFQSQDIVQHSKIIERRLIATLDDYLTEHGVDSSEFLQRTTAILNNGVLNTGSGSINAENMAVGENSAVSVQESGNA
jgi:hypothetical protein